MPNVPHPDTYPDAFWGLMFAYFTIIVLILYFCVRNFYCMRRHSVQPDHVYSTTTIIVRHPEQERCRNASYSNTQLIAVFGS